MVVDRSQLKRWIRSSAVPSKLQEQWLFFLKLGYWPNFTQPESFSEKLHYRKMHEDDDRLVYLSDKVRVRNYVEQKVGREYLIPLLYSGDTISADDIYHCGDGVVVKRNNDSGSASIIDTNSRALSTEVAEALMALPDYGSMTNEWWYSKIGKQFLVERKLTQSTDYKFFVFKQPSGEPFIVIELMDRKGGDVYCGVFDQEMQVLDVQRKGSLPLKSIEHVNETAFSEMVRIAKRLAEDFNFIRVDLYFSDGRIFFGELTFCPSEGRLDYSDRDFDYYLGSKWHELLL